MPPSAPVNHDHHPDDDGDPATLDLRLRIIDAVTARPGLSRREINEALPDVEPRDISARLQCAGREGLVLEVRRPAMPPRYRPEPGVQREQ